jgi:hypothetical protein
MKIAIMQPYIFPYIGYFQLVYATDVFVFYDDVNFINKGWINRNRILVNGEAFLFTVPCKDASQNKLIKDIGILNDPKAIQKLLATIRMAYKKAPFFDETYPFIENIFKIQETTSIAQLAMNSVVGVCDLIGLKRTFKISSAEYDNQALKKADRLIDICHREGIKDYVNPSGGQEIYTKEYYKSKDIDLSFLIPEKTDYVQFHVPFVPWLSVIDVLMFNSKEDIKNKILPTYQLI